MSPHRLTRGLTNTALALGLTLCVGCKAMEGMTPSWLKKQPATGAQASAEKPLKLTTQQSADVKIAIAQSLEKEGKLTEAAAIYDELIRADKRRWFQTSPHRAVAYHRLAIVNDKRGEFGNAEKAYLEAIALDPDNAKLHSDLGYSYFLQHRYAEAEANLVRALELRPEFARAHNNLALVLAHTGKLDQAHKAFVRAGCSPAEAHTNLAYAFLLEQKWSDAQRHFDLALACDPSIKPAKEGAATLQTVASKNSNVNYAFAPEGARPETRPLPPTTSEAHQVQYRQ